MYNLSEVLHKRITVKKLRRMPEMISSISPSTTCFVEVDVAAGDIMNMELHSSNGVFAFLFLDNIYFSPFS